MSSPARHRKPPRFAPARASMTARHRKPSPMAAALQRKPARVAAAMAGSVLVASAGPAAGHWAGEASRLATSGQASAFATLGSGALLSAPPGGLASLPLTSRRTAGLPQLGSAGRAGGPTRHPSAGRPAGRHRRPPQQQTAVSAPYLNPFRDVGGLIPERVDMGVDFGGSGPVHALGDAVITSATGSSGGWPGGGWITYQLTDGPDAGLMVYLAEDVTPTVQAGQHVSAGAVIATMFDGGDGIETGWAQPDGSSAESQLPAAGGISGGGPFPTMIGLNFEEMLQSLGVPAANNRADAAYGVLPSNYPTSW